jgi:hypothetical protein
MDLFLIEEHLGTPGDPDETIARKWIVQLEVGTAKDAYQRLCEDLGMAYAPPFGPEELVLIDNGDNPEAEPYWWCAHDGSHVWVEVRALTDVVRIGDVR